MDTADPALAARSYLLRLEAAKGESSHTLKAYASDLRDYLRFVDSKGDDAFATEAIVAYADHLSNGRKAAPRTVRRRLACLKGFFKELVRIGTLGVSPFQNLELQIPRARPLPRALSRDEAANLVAAAWEVLDYKRRSRRDQDFALGLLVALSVGLRVSEIVGLGGRDFDPVAGALRVRGKGSRDRIVFIVDSRLVRALTELTKRPSPPALFLRGPDLSWTARAFRERLAIFARENGLSRHVTPHMLRHTAATLLLEDGVDVLFLQKLLGHQDISTTSIYAHVADASLKKVLERAGLLASLTHGTRSEARR